MSYGTTELPYTAARIKGIIKATGQITVKPAGLAGIQLDCNGATGDFTASITPANLTGNRRWILPNRDDTFAGLGAQTFTGAQTIANNLTIDRPANLTLAFTSDNTSFAELKFANRSGSGLSLYRPASSSALSFYSNDGGYDLASFTSPLIGSGALSILYTAASTSTTTGALVVTGGVGIGGRLNVGGALEVNSATLIKSNTTLTDGAAAAVGTLTNAPTAGNPTKWVLINDNGVIRKFPTWT